MSIKNPGVVAKNVSDIIDEAAPALTVSAEFTAITEWLKKKLPDFIILSEKTKGELMFHVEHLRFGNAMNLLSAAFCQLIKMEMERRGVEREDFKQEYNGILSDLITEFTASIERSNKRFIILKNKNK